MRMFTLTHRRISGSFALSLYVARIFAGIENWFANVCILFLDAILTRASLTDVAGFNSDDSKEIVKAIFKLLIWGPYMFLSKRVKTTFVR